MTASRSRLVTADELLDISEDDARLELIDGVLQRFPHGTRLESAATARIGAILVNFVGDRAAGEVLLGRVGCVIGRDPDTVLAPDVCFVARERLARLPPDGFLPFAPDLVVEVLSARDRAGAVAAKTQRWLAAGARLLWNVDPQAREIVAFVPGEPPRVYTADDEIPGEPVLPGFRARVADLLG